MKIAVGCDHAGFPLKQEIAALLRKDHEVVDVGAFSAEPSDYPDFAEAVGRAVLDGTAERGVLVCGSGVGASVAANKLPGIRAAICHDAYSAHQGVEHDDMNVLVLGGRIVGHGPGPGAGVGVRGRAVQRGRAPRAPSRKSQGDRETLSLKRRSAMSVTTQPAVVNPLAKLPQVGQSVWLDFIRRSLISGGELQRLVEEDALGGRDQQPRHLPEGDRRQQRLRRGHRGAREGPGALRQGRLREPGHQGHPGHRRRAAPGVRPHEGPRRVREPGGLPRPGQGHRRAPSRRRGACGRPWPGPTS